MSPARNTEELLERPLTARSIIASLLLGMHPPRLASRRLVQWCRLFGVSEGTARVALSRMVERGELVAADGVYELAGSVRRRQPAQEWVLAPQLEPWEGRWLLAVVGTNGPRAANERAALRTAAAAARLAELREGLWGRPHNLPRPSAPDDVWEVLDQQCAWWTAEPSEPSAELVARLFAPDRWAERATVLADRLEAVIAALADERFDALATGFITGAAALQHVRHDPLLPPELLPPTWPGDRLRQAYQQYRVTYGDTVAAWFNGQG